MNKNSGDINNEISTAHGPDFIGIGMERSGTSWLFKMLASHPDIWVPPLKELHYFDGHESARIRRHFLARLKHRAALFKAFEDRPELYKNTAREYLRWDLGYFTGQRSERWYKALFHQRYTKGRVCGEVTPAYANISDATISYLVNSFPQTKFILMLRHPYARMKSGLLHHFKVEQERDLKDVRPEEMEGYLKKPDVRERSSVSHILYKWLAHVPEDRFFISLQDNEPAHARAFLSELYEFLGVDRNFQVHDDVLARPVNVYSRDEDNQYIPDYIANYMQEFAEEEFARLNQTHPQIVSFWLSADQRTAR